MRSDCGGQQLSSSPFIRNSANYTTLPSADAEQQGSILQQWNISFYTEIVLQISSSDRLNTASVSGTECDLNTTALILKVTHVLGYRGRGEPATRETPW